ncbi:MAG: radical SAM protein [Bacteriovoracaceae bacterium]|nr:radical SAM protein [Bacteriovoracaceae bacterium]
MIKSLYIHYPYCRHLCNYCDFYKLKQTPEQREHQEKLFQNYLTSSLKILQEKVHEEYQMNFAPLETLYVGGGTPSLLGASGAKWLQQFLKTSHLNFAASGHEFTLEIDPGTMTVNDFETWQISGVNRYSFGLQTLDEKLIEVCDRKSKMSDVIETLELISAQDVNFSVDFLLGIPHSGSRHLESELKRILTYRPKHISLYILNPKTNYPLKKFIPEDEWVANEYQFVDEFLSSHGFRHYEVSNYAIPGYEGKHNYGYWFRKNIAALGPSAAGHYQYGDNQFLRYVWKESLLKQEYDLEILKNDQVLLENFYLRFRVAENFDLDVFQNLPPKESSKLVGLFSDWAQKKYLLTCEVSSKTQYQFTPQGWIILDSLMKELLSRIKF